MKTKLELSTESAQPTKNRIRTKVRAGAVAWTN
jgi:hypothetical protein